MRYPGLKKNQNSHLMKAARALRTLINAVCESLEPRQLLTTYTYPVDPSYTAVYLRGTATRGRIEVHLGSFNGPIGTTFTDTSGLDVIDWGSTSNYTTYDLVPAAKKPYGNSDSGIKIQGGSAGTLEIDAASSDTLIQVTDANTITTNDGTYTGTTKRTAAVSHLTLVASDDGNTEIDASADSLILSNLTVKTGAGTGDTIKIGGGDDSSVTGVAIQTGAGNDTVDVQQDDDFDGATTVTVDFGAGSGSGNGLGLGNVLNIGTLAVGAHGYSGSGCTVTLAQDDSHVIVVDSVTVDRGGQLVVADATTIGALNVFVGSDGYGFAGSVSVQAPLIVATSASTNGICTVDGNMEFTGTSSPSTIHQFAVFQNNAQDSPGSVQVDASATVTIATSSAIGTLSIPSTGRVIMPARSGSYGSNSPSVLAVGALNMGATPAGKLDLNDNDLVIDYDTSNPIGSWNGSAYTGVLGLIATGRNGGSWNGIGIDSTVAHDFSIANSAPNYYVVGVGEAGNKYGSGGGNFDGRSVDLSAVLVKFTYGGDADLTGHINIDDYTHIDQGIAASYNTWWCGDFNYDGKINIDDYTTVIDPNISTQGATL